jgi:hypothetical protein
MINEKLGVGRRIHRNRARLAREDAGVHRGIADQSPLRNQGEGLGGRGWDGRGFRRRPFFEVVYVGVIGADSVELAFSDPEGLTLA